MQTLESSLFVWLLYCGAVGVGFVIIKWVNHRLHFIYDTTEVTEEKTDSIKNTDNDSKSEDIG